MIKWMEKPNSDKEIFESLHPIVGEWFRKKFGSFTESQRYALLNIRDRKNILVSSPTGSGKTLCAFASILNYLISLDERNELEDKVYCIYVSPLKALSRDIEVNLKEPLEDMERLANKKFKIRVSVRTGDTTPEEKTKQLKHPPHILITTPESLAIILSSSRFIEHLRATEFCIVDEIHAMANKRGVHLSLSLERLQHTSIIPLTRIGLSATISPLEEIARFLVGYDNKERDCLIADVQFAKKLDMRVLCPVPDLINTSAQEMQKGLYSLIDKLIQEHKTTLIFTNTRSATERVIHHLKEMFPSRYTEDIGAHHSSLSKQHRFDIEQRLREGRLKVVVTSTSLELGIDIGYIDLVILLGSPKSVARAIQRIGRAGHKLHDVARGRIIVLDQDDLVECAVLLKEAIERKIDSVQVPKNCLDVLAQQIYGCAIQQKWSVDGLFSLIRNSYCYNTLSKEDFFSVISYLAGEYSLEARDVYAKIWYDEKTRELGKRGRLARMIYMTNIGTIPEESFVNVVIAGGDHRNERIGVIDEAFLERLRQNDVFVLGGHKYEFLYARGMNAYVKASVYRQPTIPSWSSEMLPLNFDLALAIQRFRKLMNEQLESKSERNIKEFLMSYLYIDNNSADAIYNYFKIQHSYAKVPHADRLVIEHFSDQGKHFVIFHSLYGRRVNDALSRALAYLAARFGGRDIEIGINDNGFFLASLEKLNVDRALKLLNENTLQQVLEEAIGKTEVFKRRFRHCATRSLMILRSYKGREKSVGKQHFKSGFLLGAVQRLDTNFPVLKETRREVLEDLMDINNAKIVLGWIKEGKLEIEQVHNEIPSPFSLNLIMQGYSDLMKIEDKIAFLKRVYELIKKEVK